MARGYLPGQQDPEKKLQHRAEATFLCQPSPARVSPVWPCESAYRKHTAGLRAAEGAGALITVQATGPPLPAPGTWDSECGLSREGDLPELSWASSG